MDRIGFERRGRFRISFRFPMKPADSLDRRAIDSASRVPDAGDNTPPEVPVPDYRPVERFWPYVDLPEQPTDEELAALNPELAEALFGTPQLPFSSRSSSRASTDPTTRARWRWRARSAEYREIGAGASLRHRARFYPAGRRQAARPVRDRRPLRRDRRADRRSPGAVRARAVAAAVVVPDSVDSREPRQRSSWKLAAGSWSLWPSSPKSSATCRRSKRS